MKYIKLRTKILAFFISMFVVLTVLLTSTTIYLYSNFLRTNTERLYESSLSLIAENINVYFNEIREMTYVTVYSSFSEKFLNAKVDINDYDYYLNAENFRLNLRNMEHSNSDIKMIFFSEVHDTAYHNLYQEYNHEYDFREDEWYSLFQNSQKNEIVITDNKELYRHVQHKNEEDSYAVIYEIRSHLTSTVNGYMLIEMPKAAVTSLIQNEHVLCENILIYDRSLMQTIFEIKGSIADWGDVIEGIDHARTDTEIDGVTVYSILNSLDWLFVFNSSYSYLLSDLPILITTSILISLIISACGIFITIHFTTRLVKPLENLNQGFERVKKSDFQFKLTDIRGDEIGDLTNNFNLMVEKIDYFVNKVQYNNLLLKQAELESLQAQINPHFLYNTLEMIIGMASEGNNDDVIYACELLGKIFKFNLGKNDFITLDEELKHVKNYVKITQLRFSGKFSVSYDVDESLLSHSVTKFILQPFVENAIVHGFSDMVSEGVIKLYVKEDDEQLIISVEDNGKGFSKTMLDNIFAQINNFDPKMEKQINLESHIGILNVVLRLKLLFNGRMFFEIVNLEKGSRTILKIPKEGGLVDDIGDDS